MSIIKTYKLNMCTVYVVTLLLWCTLHGGTMWYNVLHALIAPREKSRKVEYLRKRFAVNC